MPVLILARCQTMDLIRSYSRANERGSSYHGKGPGTAHLTLILQRTYDRTDGRKDTEGERLSVGALVGEGLEALRYQCLRRSNL